MNLLQRVEYRWNESRGDIEHLLCEWLEHLSRHKGKPYKIFRSPPSLKIYTSIGRGKLNFSLRFMGQEVGEVEVDSHGEVFLVLKDKHVKYHANFGITNLAKNRYLWRGKDAGKFRKVFQENWRNPPKGLKLRSSEHRIESWIIHEMLKKTRKKFQGRLLQIQPVTIGGVPLQWPLPISASSGEPQKSFGHIDILARRRFGGKVNLSVWELKAPDVYKKALREGYIYAVTLLKILRDTPKGIHWYSAFGFKERPALPSQLTIEVVVVITRSQLGNMKQELSKYQNEMPLDVGQDRIIFSVALYDKDTLEIDDFQENILCNS